MKVFSPTIKRFSLIAALAAAMAGCSTRSIHVANSFSLPDVHGEAQQLFSSDAPATVVIFITAECPIANGYAPEINSIVADYQVRGVAFHAVHVDPNVTFDAAAAHAKEYGYKCLVLIDPEIRLATVIGATVTPEAAVVDSQQRLVYLGRIDDRYTDFGKKRFQPTQRDLREALDSILAGEKVANPRTRAIGCYIAGT